MATFSVSPSARAKNKKGIIIGLLVFALPLIVLGAWYTTYSLAGLIPMTLGLVFLVPSVIALALGGKQIITIDDEGIKSSGNALASANKTLMWKDITQAKLTGMKKSPNLILTSSTSSIAVVSSLYENSDDILNMITDQLDRNEKKVLDERQPVNNPAA